MTEYDYFIAGFLASDADLMRQLILAQGTLSPTFSYMDADAANVSGVDGFALSVFFTAPLGSTAVLDGMMAGYMTSVPVAKTKKLTLLQTTVQNYVELHYSMLIRVQFINLYMLAKNDGLTNRAAYIRPGLDWMNSILSYAATAANAIQALSTVSAVQSYTIDVAGNVGADPLLTVGAAVLIIT